MWCRDARHARSIALPASLNLPGLAAPVRSGEPDRLASDYEAVPIDGIFGLC